MTNATMRAVVATGYGSPEVLRLVEVPRPVPTDDEILIRVHATTVSAADRRVRSLQMPRGFGLLARLMFGVTRPRQPILGTDLAGVIEAVGRRVRGFSVGDEVFGASGGAMGCHAEYRVMPAGGAVAHRPAGLSLAEAAALPFGGAAALGFLRRGGVRPGHRVLVHGASGAVGTAAVQLARHFGAEVSGVCGPQNLELVRSLGATHVIDHTRSDFARGGARYDLILDTTGTLGYARARDALADDGRLLLVAASLPQLLQAPWVAAVGRRRIVAGPVPDRAEDLRFLARLAETGELRPVIDHCFPFEQMADAHRHAERRGRRGSVVVTLVPQAGA